MTDSVTAPVKLPDDKPPDWANSLMKWAVTTPGIQGWVGQGVALLTFTGRRTGKKYDIPVSYHRDGDVVTVITKKLRTWWRNFESPAEITVRLAGEDHRGMAEVTTDQDEALEFMVDYLAKRPIDAKAYGLAKDEITREKIARVVPYIVLIKIALTPTV